MPLAASEAALPLLAALAAVLVGCASELPPPKGAWPVEVHGHRGARALAPENTLPSFAKALEAGAEGIELDVCATADDVLAVTHDPLVNAKLCRYDDGSPVPHRLAVRSLTFADLERLDCGSLPNEKFPGQAPVPGTRIPSLDQLLDWLAASPLPAARTVKLDVEAKVPKHGEGPAVAPDLLARLVVETLARHGMTGRATLLSFDPRVLAAAHRLEPSLPTCLNVDDPYADLPELARRAGVGAVGVRHRYLTAEAVTALRAEGVKVLAWTANSPASWDRLVMFEVDAIVTDDPGACLAHLRERGWRKGGAAAR